MGKILSIIYRSLVVKRGFTVCRLVEHTVQVVHVNIESFILKTLILMAVLR